VAAAELSSVVLWLAELQLVSHRHTSWEQHVDRLAPCPANAGQQRKRKREKGEGRRIKKRKNV
jgi:hypothetical protein